MVMGVIELSMTGYLNVNCMALTTEPLLTQTAHLFLLTSSQCALYLALYVEDLGIKTFLSAHLSQIIRQNTQTSYQSSICTLPY